MKRLVPLVIFEDQNVLVISKPAGLLSQGGTKGDSHLVDWAQKYVGRHYIGLVHRLDRNTSGLMVLAKRTKAASRLTRSLQEGDLQRTYFAWLVGALSSEQVWEHWLLKNERMNRVTVFKRETPKAKFSSLKAIPLQRAKFQNRKLTLAEFHLETGRSHQIRAQAAAMGFPLLGDKKYGSPISYSRPALHSGKIGFPHPISGEVLEFEDPLPGDMQRILEVNS